MENKKRTFADTNSSRCAVTDKSQRSRGISGFIVEKDTRGFTFGTKEKKMGIRDSATYEFVFTDCKISKENLLGELGKGFKMALMTLDGGRIGVAAQAKQDHEPFSHFAAMGKLYAAEADCT